MALSMPPPYSRTLCTRCSESFYTGSSWFTLMTSSFTLEGNRELLAIKLPLEEWRHWLEGSQHPFTVLTNHKNLQYLREAKRLNPRQAHWTLFTRFNYTISYRPGPKNTKADALSRLHTPEEAKWNQNPSSTKHSLSASYNGTPTLTPPPMLPRPLSRAVHRGTVCRTQRTPLIHPVHASLGTGHPGANNIPLAAEKTATGGETWPGMSEGSFKAVRTTPFRKALATYQPASSSRCPFPTSHGHTWG